MRRCPICQRTYDDNMKFCQADGTPLVDETANTSGEDDPFKTVLAEPQDDFAGGGAAGFDPMKTMLAAPPQVDLPPPSPFGEPETKVSHNTPFKEAPSFGDLSTPQFNNAPLPSETSSASENNYSGGFGQTPLEPFGQIQSEPFGQPRSDPFGQPQQQSENFDNAPRTPTFQEPEPPFGGQPNFGQQPFGGPPSEWTPPPVPQTGWDNQGLGQNTPFSPPPVRAGINQTLPIVSLGLGVASITIGWCCSLGLLLAPAALITGGIGLSQIKKNPQTHGGKGLAIGGMATAGVFLALYILFIIIYGIAMIGGGLLNR